MRNHETVTIGLMCKNLSLRNVAQYHQSNLVLFLNLLYQNKQKSLEWTNPRRLLLPNQMTTQGSLNVNQKQDIVNSQKFNYILDKLSAAVIEVVTDKNEFDKILKNHNIPQKMETSSTEEKNPLFLADEKELKAFAQKVDDWKAGKLASTEFISEFSTSTVLQAINIPANKVSITQDVLQKINELETVKVGKSYGHDIDIATIKKIPEFLADPVMVFSSSSTPDS